MKRQKGVMGLYNKAVVAGLIHETCEQGERIARLEAENTALVERACEAVRTEAVRLAREAVADIRRRLEAIEHPDLAQLSLLCQRSADLYRPFRGDVAAMLQELACALEVQAAETAPEVAS